MINKLYTLNSYELNLEDQLWEVRSLKTFDELEKIGSNYHAILVVTLNSPEQINSLVTSKKVKRLNIPCVFILSEECSGHAKQIFDDGFTFVFNKGQSPWLIKAHIENIFKNYPIHRSSLTKRILHSFDFNALTKKERQIIELLSESPKFSCGKKDLYELIWGSSELNTNTLEVHLCNLKRKLREAPFDVKSTFDGCIMIEV